MRLQLALVTLLLLPLALPVHATGGAIEDTGADTAMTGAHAWTGSAMLLFGGYSGNTKLTTVRMYDPATNAVTTLNATFPDGVGGAAAVWTGTYAYVFGGSGRCWSFMTDDGVCRWVHRYDPVNDTITRLSVLLPEKRSAASAFFDGTYAYVAGGYTLEYQNPASEIYRFDPSNETFTTVSTAYPEDTIGAAVAWVSPHAYFLGGDRDRITRFTPSNASVQVMGATLPGNLTGASGTAVDGKVYLYGGFDLDLWETRAHVLRYDPATDTLAHMASQLPTASQTGTAVSNGTVAWFNAGGNILRHTPSLDSVSANHAPVASIAALSPAECSNGGATFLLNASGSTDADGDTLSFVWGPFSGTGATLSHTFPPGENPFHVYAKDWETYDRADATAVVTDSYAPTVSITAPYGSTAQSPATVSASASDACGLDGVSFTFDGETKWDFSPPYSVVFTTGAAPRVGTLVVTAYDITGHETSAQKSLVVTPGV